MISATRASPTPSAKAAERMTSADPQIPQQPASVDNGATLVGKRLRKSFGARFFWGSVVGCYHIAEAQFYKICFDDGDVDILSAAEVMQDVQQAETHASEDKSPTASVTVTASMQQLAMPSQRLQPSIPPITYQDELRRMTLKRKRGVQLEPGVPSPLITFRVTLWEQRLYVSIVTNKGVTTVAGFMKRNDGSPGEVEATRIVRTGDIITQINSRPIDGLDSTSVSAIIKSSRRPLVLTFQRLRSGGAQRPEERAGLPESEAGRASKPQGGADSAPTASSAEPPAPAAAASSLQRPAETSPSSPSPPARSQDPISSPGDILAVAPSPPTPAPQSFSAASVSRAAAALSRYKELHQNQNQPRHHHELVSRAASSVVTAPPLGFRNPAFVQQLERHVQTQQSHSSQYPEPTGSQSSMAQYLAQHHLQSALRAYEAPQSYLRANGSSWDAPHSAGSGHQSAATGSQWVGMPLMSAPHPNSSTGFTVYTSSRAPSYSQQQQQYSAPQSAYLQHYAESRHPTAIQAPYAQQGAPSQESWEPTTTTENRGTGGSFLRASSGSNYYSTTSRNSAAAPGGTVASEFSHSHHRYEPTEEHRPNQPAPPSSLSSRETMPARDASDRSAQSLSQPRPDSSSQYYSSASADASDRSSSTSESRFVVIESAQDSRSKEQRQPRKAPGEINGDGAESDEPVGRFEPEDGFEGEDTQTARASRTGMAPLSGSPSTAKSLPPYSFPAAAAAAVGAEPTLADEETSFLSPSNASFVAKLPSNIGNRYVPTTASLSPQQQQQQQQLGAHMQHLTASVPMFNGEACVVVRILRTRLHVTLGSLGSMVSITSFTRGKHGEIGEIEESGKVFVGDMIVAINGVSVMSNTSPTEVARVVMMQRRPLELYFQRASWDVLTGEM